jgi:hypothetical protein
MLRNTPRLPIMVVSFLRRRFSAVVSFGSAPAG